METHLCYKAEGDMEKMCGERWRENSADLVTTDKDVPVQKGMATMMMKICAMADNSALTRGITWPFVFRRFNCGCLFCWGNSGVF